MKYPDNEFFLKFKGSDFSEYDDFPHKPIFNPYIPTMKILFLKIAEPYGCFSNFSRHPITVNGDVWKTTEAYYQAQKFEDIDIRERIRLAISPWVAAQIGRDPSLPLRKDWEEVKEKIMKEVLWYKVNQHKDVKDTLLSTEDNELVEHSPRDHYWADGGDGSGKNRLGILWMEVREELRKQL